MKAIAVLSVCSLVTLAAARCEASPIVLYDNFGPSQSYNTTNAYSVTGADFPRLGLTEGAVAFTPASNVTFSSVQLPVANVEGTNSLMIGLYADAGGQPSATPLESFTFTGLTTYPASGLIEGDSVLHPLLLAGATYWIAALPIASDTGDAWFLNSTGAVGRSYNNGAGWVATPTDTAPALEVLGAAPAPEPSTRAMLIALGVGLAVIATFKHSRANGTA